MKVSELAALIEAQNMTPGVTEDREISCGYTCDLLSWVMAHGEEGMAWVTVQTHMNVIAVAVLAEMACVVMPEGIDMPEESLKKAEEEGLAVLKTRLTAFAVCGLMARAGIPDRG